MTKSSPNRDKENKPSKSAVDVSHLKPNGERGGTSAKVASNSTANKPIKKTEWVDKLDLLLMKNIRVDDNGYLILKNVHTDEWLKPFISNLLHQRDNEIREKIQGMGFSEDEEGLMAFEKGYNQALDDLLTYLSNRKV